MSRRAASPETMATRTEVAAALTDLVAGQHVLVACSGGPDSLALAAATAWVAERAGLVASAIVVDHGLQDGSARVARDAADTCALLGLSAEVRRVDVGSDGGPEAAARAARYAALEEEAARTGAVAVLLGHTRDDQAETVLLRLARGAGARSLAAMSRRTGLWRRPFLDLSRTDVHAASAAALAPLGREPWLDPHNADPDFARVRVRALLAGLGDDLGPGVVLGLARSADLLRDDADALDALAEVAYAQAVHADDAGVSASVEDLVDLLPAVRTRVIRRMAMAAGSVSEALSLDHIRRVDALLVDWRGQGEVALPCGVVAHRACGRLCLQSA